MTLQFNWRNSYQVFDKDAQDLQGAVLAVATPHTRFPVIPRKRESKGPSAISPATTCRGMPPAVPTAKGPALHRRVVQAAGDGVWIPAFAGP